MKYLDKTAISARMGALAEAYKGSLLGESVKCAFIGEEKSRYRLFNWRDDTITESVYETQKEAYAALAEQEIPTNFLVVHAMADTSASPEVAESIIGIDEDKEHKENKED